MSARAARMPRSDCRGRLQAAAQRSVNGPDTLSIEAGRDAGQFHVADAEVALSAVTGALIGLLRMHQRHPERIGETSVDGLAEACLRLLGLPAAKAKRLAHMTDLVLAAVPDFAKTSVDWVQMTPMEISSTEIRQRIDERRPVSEWMDPDVLRYIEENKLYRR